MFNKIDVENGMVAEVRWSDGEVSKYLLLTDAKNLYGNVGIVALDLDSSSWASNLFTGGAEILKVWQPSLGSFGNIEENLNEDCLVYDITWSKKTVKFLRCVGSENDSFTNGNAYEVKQIDYNYYKVRDNKGEEFFVPLNGGLWQFEVM